MTVSAEDKDSSNRAQITVTNDDSNRLSDKDIENFMEQHEKNKEEDEKMYQKVMAKNNLEQQAYRFSSAF
ncbi:Endoplasmic reticulum chaperone BiP [Bonamia ostreae]|uniref:Endoplasmic reticulum chaperone BiP n=1 Tax=Bonamia ostreae TaxID=126728 RepID=A0ABV2AGB0_9EUKA